MEHLTVAESKFNRMLFFKKKWICVGIIDCRVFKKPEEFIPGGGVGGGAYSEVKRTRIMTVGNPRKLP